MSNIIKGIVNETKAKEKEADYGPEYQAMAQRAAQRAKELAGGSKTVWVPDEYGTGGRYKVVPANQQKEVKEDESSPDTDQILQYLTKAVRMMQDHKDSFSEEGWDRIKRSYEFLRSYLKDGDYDGFLSAYNEILRNYPDSSGVLIDEMFAAAGLGEDATIEDFLAKVSSVEEGRVSDAYRNGTYHSKPEGETRSSGMFSGMMRAKNAIEKSKKSQKPNYNKTCDMCNRSGDSCICEGSGEFVLYINDKPAAKYNSKGEAEQDIILVKQRVPNARCEIKQEVCKMATIPSKVTEEFINELQGVAEGLSDLQRQVAMARLSSRDANRKKLAKTGGTHKQQADQKAEDEYLRNRRANSKGVAEGEAEDNFRHSRNQTPMADRIRNSMRGPDVGDQVELTTIKGRVVQGILDRVNPDSYVLKVAGTTGGQHGLGDKPSGNVLVIKKDRVKSMTPVLDEAKEFGERDMQLWAARSPENQKIYNAYRRVNQAAEQAWANKDGAEYTGLQARRKQIRDLIGQKMFGNEGVMEDLPPPENARKTQIAGTLPTYKKAADLLNKTGVQGKALDFGAGLGMGTSELGKDAHSYEPFPGDKFKPHFVDVTKIPDNSYHKIVNLNVLNVVPNVGDHKIRDSIVKNIGRVLAPGGVALITTRGKDVLTIKGTPGEEPMSMISKIGTYQKGFSQTELKQYIQSVLGDGFDVSSIKLGPAGVMIKKLDQGEVNEASYNDVTGGDFPTDYTGAEMENGVSSEKWAAMLEFYSDDIRTFRALKDLQDSNQRAQPGGYSGSPQYVATIESPGIRQGQPHVETKYFKSKAEAYKYAQLMPSRRITSLEKLEQDETNPVTYNVILGIGEHRRMMKLTFASEQLAQEWENRHRHVVKIQWNDERSEYEPPKTPRKDAEKKEEEPEEPGKYGYDTQTGEPLKKGQQSSRPQPSARPRPTSPQPQQWHTSQQLGHTKPSKYNKDDVTDVEVKEDEMTGKLKPINPIGRNEWQKKVMMYYPDAQILVAKTPNGPSIARVNNVQVGLFDPQNGIIKIVPPKTGSIASGTSLEEAGYGRNRGYAHGFASPTAPELGRRSREDDEGNSEFDDKMRKLTGMIFYNVTDPEKAQQLGLKQTRTGKWFLRTGNRLAQQVADKAFGPGKIWYPKNESVAEDWQKTNKHDKTDGMSRKAVKAYRRENPGSKLKTAVTTKPSKLKKGSKAANRRKSFCARMSGMKKAHASAKTKRDPNSPINKALRRWHCESVEQMQELMMIAEQKIQEAKSAKQQAAIAIAKKEKAAKVSETKSNILKGLL